MEKTYANATILEGEELEVTSGYITVEEGRIKEVGEGSPHRNYEDLKRGIVCPSFTNAHTHIGDACAQDFEAYRSIGERVGPGGAKFDVLANEQNVREGIRYAFKEMQAQGTGAFADFREGGLEGAGLLKEELERAEIRGVILGRPDSDSVEELLENCHGLGISSLKAYEKSSLRRWRKLADKSGKIFALHSGETEDDIAEALKLEPDFLVHLTSAREESLQRVSDARVRVVLCPRANASLAVGMPNIKHIMENTLSALGTDNVMANSLSMLCEAEFAFKCARGLSRDYSFQAREVLKAATLNGRKILGLPSNAIEEGNPASLVMFRGNKYLYDPLLGIIHRFEKSDILKFIAGG